MSGLLAVHLGSLTILWVDDVNICWITCMVTFTGNTFHNGKNSKRLDVFKVGARERGKYECASGPIPADQSQWTNPSGRRCPLWWCYVSWQSSILDTLSECRVHPQALLYWVPMTTLTDPLDSLTYLDPNVHMHWPQVWSIYPSNRKWFFTFAQFCAVSWLAEAETAEISNCLLCY